MQSQRRELPPEYQAKTQFQRQYSSSLNAKTAHELVVQFMSETEMAQKLVIELTSKTARQDLRRRRRRQLNQRRRRTLEGVECSNAAIVLHQTQEVPKQKQYDGFRKDYLLGDTIGSPSHMITEPTADRAIQAAHSLKQHDFAFIRRSGGSYSYAILAHSSFKPIKGAKNNATEECMTFVVNCTGYTKMIRRRHWSEFVRLVSVEGCVPRYHPVELPQVPVPVEEVCQEQEIEDDDVDMVPPREISFISQADSWSDYSNECSLISSVSDRARRE